MKKLQALCAAIMLVIALSVSAQAGEITTGAVSPPPPPPASAMATEPGHIGTDATVDPTQNFVQSETLVSELTLSLLQLLSLL